MLLSVPGECGPSAGSAAMPPAPNFTVRLPDLRAWSSPSKDAVRVPEPCRSLHGATPRTRSSSLAGGAGLKAVPSTVGLCSRGDIPVGAWQWDCGVHGASLCPGAAQPLQPSLCTS